VALADGTDVVKAGESLCNIAADQHAAGGRRGLHKEKAD
jgi:hypothetical protein